MNMFRHLALAGVLITLSTTGFAASPLPRFYGDAPDNHHPWTIHDPNRPQPAVVTPGTFSTQEQPGKPPSDAKVLFDGTSLSKWEADEGVGIPTKWIIKNGAMECVPGSGFIRTKETFGDCQLHVEWAAPTKVEGESQGRGNSGVFLMGLVEVQVLDNFNNPTYADGFASSVYGQHPPMANALRPSGEFQVYDIVFRRPIYRGGKLIDPGYVTVFVNGVLVQDHAIIEGVTGHMARTKPAPFPDQGALKLQDHGNPVRYRNIWYRELPPRIVEGSTDGYLTTSATLAKRKQIAASIRADAATLKNDADILPEMLRWMESLVYEKNSEASKRVKQLSGQYVASLKDLAPDKLAAKKNEVKSVRDAFRYLAKFKILSENYAAKAALEQIVKDQGWDKKQP
jgi:hypothetical protein